MPPELELLLCCSRSRISGPTVDRMKELLAAGIDWERACAMARSHGVEPLLYSGLNEGCPDAVPPDVFDRLRDSYNNSARSGLILTGRLFRLLDLFQAAQIPVMALKGPVLAESLYRDPALRQFGDLDLLIHERDIGAAGELLAREGYQLNSALAWAPPEVLIDLNCELLYSRKCGTHVDLHWEIAPVDYPFRFDTEIFWSSRQMQRIAGRAVQSLSPESQLLFLCVHAAKHMWTCLKWTCDVARLVEIQPEMDWTKALELADRLCSEHVVLLGLLLAHDLLEAPLPPDVLRRVEADRVIGPLAMQVKRRLSQKPGVEPESLELVTFNARMADRVWDKIRHFAAVLKAPKEADVMLLRLPPKLFFLYYPFRAWRLAVKYGLRLAGRR